MCASHLGLGEVIAALRQRLCSPLVLGCASGPDGGFSSSTDPSTVRQWLAEIDGLLARRAAVLAEGRGGRWVEDALRDVMDIAEPLLRVTRGTVLEPIDLVEVARVSAAAVTLGELRTPSVVTGADAAAPEPDAVGLEALALVLDGLQGNPVLAARLTRSLDLDGDEPGLADAASPELSRARANARLAKQELAAAAQRLIAQPEVSEALADRFWTERQGRVVLPIKAGSLSRGRGPGGVAGIIHGSSTSGQTFFVEPNALVEDNNRLRHAQARARVEERRVLEALSAAVREDAEPLRQSMDAMARLDRVLARTALSERLGGVAPEVYDPSHPQAPGLRLPSVRHPGMVLAGAEVVPNDLSIATGEGLIVSGPNAGGKTVALKTIGLSVLMAQMGIRLPTATPADVPLFRCLVTDVGDGQSISANLSTFTAHLSHVQRALDAAQHDAAGTLVLLDEVAVGTDPDQGAALAEAIVDRLVELGATVVVTTHYERLKLLATRPAPAPRFANAAVGFDLEELRPTFEVRIGLPGSSSALAVARRLGLPEVVLSRAHAMLDDSRLAVDVLLTELEAERVAMAKAREAVAEERRALAQRVAQLDARERGEEQSEALRRSKAHREATQRLGELDAEIRRRRQQLNRAPLEEAPDGQAPPPDAQARSFAGDARRGLAQQAASRPAPEGVPPSEVSVGDRVWVTSLECEGDVVSVKGRRVTVQLATLKTSVDRDQLRPRTRAAKPRARAPKGGGKPNRARRYFGSDANRFDPGLDDVVDLRGQRAEEAVTMMEVFLDRAVGEDRDVVLLRHGHGTGALRKALREALDRLRHVAEHRAGLSAEGGEAVTVVWVKG
ncbi:MAG: Smr/MutS family protein [Nannocystaceae bacterium]|nr:Smr/MutS family protein [Nannocystaceae bacterium]